MRRCLAHSWLWLIGVAGCASKGGATAPNLSDCTTCGIVNPGGTVHIREGGAEPEAGGTGPGDAIASSDAGGVDVTLPPLSMLSEATFSKDPILFSGPVKVTSFNPAGNVVDTGSEGVRLAQVLGGVATGPNWFAVQDMSPTLTLAPTLQPANVSSADPTVALSALNAGQLAQTNIDGELLMGPVQGEATVVLVFRRAGKAVTDVSVSGAPGAATVAYYTGTPFPYQSQIKGTKATGADSTAIITHVPAAAQFPSLIALTLTCTEGNQPPFDVKVNVAQTFVSWVPVEVK